jgi:hypothetical protein
MASKITNVRYINDIGFRLERFVKKWSETFGDLLDQLQRLAWRLPASMVANEVGRS